MEKSIPTHAVKAVITDEHGAILFLRRNGAARADGKSNWDLPGGLVEKDESDEEALVREAGEELGVMIQVGNRLGEWTFFRPHDSQTVTVTNYEATLLAGGNDFTLSSEHTAAKFVARAQLQGLEVKDPSIFKALGE